MPERGGYIASGTLHLLLVLLFVFGLPNLFKREIPQDMPLVVQLVKLGPETRATEVAKTPPKPDAKPEVVQETPPPPKPIPPKPEPPKPEAPKPPPTPTPPVPPEPPKPPEPKPLPPPPTPPQPPPPPPPEPKPSMEAPPPKPQETKVENVPAPPPPKPTPPKPKPTDANFDTILKNLAKSDPSKNAPDPKSRQPSPPPPKSSSQPIAPLGPQLTASELDLVKQQIYECWNVPAGARDATDLTPEFRVTMNVDGTVRNVVLLNTERMGEPYFQAAADSARRALLNPRCSPLRLPPDKYNQWQTFTITFDPKDIAG